MRFQELLGGFFTSSELNMTLTAKSLKRNSHNF